MTEELKPCPCGGQVYVGELRFTGETQWSVGCLHCGIAVRRADKAAAISAWNMTTTPPTEDDRGELIKRLKDMRNELHVNELRNSGSADGNIYSRWGAIVSQATIALLSSPRVEDARREALEEAVKVAEHVYGKNVLTGPYAHMDDTPELESARDAATEIAKAIRALFPPVKDTK